ncbi:MAG: glycerol kinase GlpK [Candidatus Omnitrophica bacterium]|nr:glycerol kinase GlpK [Candidatus Omnitrophota bacterium]
MSVILAIDQGTTGTSAMLVDRRGRLVARAYQELPQHFPKPGWVEHDGRAILDGTMAVIAKALRAARLKPAKLAAIGLTNQRETTLLWSRRTGRPMARAIVWQCRRSAPLCEQLRRRGREPLFRRKTGLVLDAYFSGTKIRWLLDHVPGARAKAAAGELAFGTVDSWLLWHLTGGKVHATDYTNASRTLVYNIHTRRWDPQLLRLLEIPRAILPDVRPSSGVFGRTAAIGPLPAGIPIAGIAGDQQASMVGHGCLEPGTAKNTYGTGCFLLLNTGGKAVSSRNGLLTTLAVGTGPEPVYALEGSVFIAGAAIQWLRDGLKLIKTAAQTQAIAASVKDTGGVYVVPAFVGLGAPYWDMAARGAVLGITRGTTREVLVRATLESLAYQTRDVVDAMQRDSGVRLSRLQVDGGAAQNDWLMQFQADMLGVEVQRAPYFATTARGAAILAGIGIGWWHARRVSDLMGAPDRVFRPRMKSAERERLYAGWREAVARVRSQAATA